VATNANIKDAMTFSTNCFGISAKTVGNAELVRMKAWFEAEYANELDGAEAVADDFAAWLWRHVAAKVKNYEQRIAEQALNAPSEFTEV
jgi:hypothetical protein